MRQTWLILSMLTSLVACPFECMEWVKSGDTFAVSAGGRCCCSHCGNETEEPGDRNSGSPYCGCICNGAVLTGRVSVSADVTSWNVNAVEVVASGLVDRAVASHDRSAVAARMRPGRSLHLALHSLQV